MIEAKHLTYSVFGHTALQDISFKIPNGKVYGILAPAGAGKSTLLGLLSGALTPDRGQVKINGFDMASEPHRARTCIGYVPTPPPLYDFMTPFEYLRFAAEAKGLPSLRAMRQIHETMELTDIDGVKNRLISNLSQAARARLGIAQALIGKPEILLLDEPAAGLDARATEEIRELIRLLAEDHTILLSSSDPTEVEALCEHAMLLSNGTMIANAPLEELSGDDETEGSLRALFLQTVTEARPADAPSVSSARKRDGKYELIDEEDAQA